jgi:hypothetical protein
LTTRQTIFLILLKQLPPQKCLQHLGASTTYMRERQKSSLKIEAAPRIIFQCYTTKISNKFVKNESYLNFYSYL